VTAERTTSHLDNRMLAAMPPAIRRLLALDLKEKSFKQGVILQEAGEPVDQIYFPQTGMISFVVITQDGAAIEAATVGREGSVGIHSAFGRRISFTRAVAQISSKCSYLPAERFRKAVENDGTVRELIERYTELMLAESQQIAICNAKHHAEERLCRWLLQTRDRIEGDILPLTQEFLSEMLGVRRTTVTLVARALQSAGLIKYRRGIIHIQDVEGLKQGACECYAAIAQHNLPNRLGFEATRP
jgi:CRP-like cAMP-binding protein